MFLDETSIIINDSRAYGRSLSGKPVIEKNGYGKQKRVTFLASLSLKQGLFAPCIFEGGLTGACFESYLENILMPELDGNETIILDNFASHKTKAVKNIMHKSSCKIMFLPPYSPDLNPIEMAWNVIKVSMRKMNKLIIDNKICKAMKSITTDNVKNWMRKCGYRKVS